MAPKAQDPYDWLDDPFDEQKAADELLAARTGNRRAALAGCGCLVVGVLVVAAAGLAALIAALG